VNSGGLRPALPEASFNFSPFADSNQRGGDDALSNQDSRGWAPGSDRRAHRASPVLRIGLRCPVGSSAAQLCGLADPASLMDDSPLCGLSLKGLSLAAPTPGELVERRAQPS
jgi:hypothetical protein